MTDTPKLCQWSFKLVLQILNSVILILVLVTQGSILDYYLIQHNGGTSGWYFWFLADFMVLIAFMASVVISYRYYKKKAKTKPLSSNANKQTQRPLPKMGALPLGYVVWLFYICLLVVKIILLFKMEIAQKLDDKATFGPQLLKVVIGMSAVVFFLQVESHHDAPPQSDRLAYLHLLVTSTAFELFDSITFLSILLPNESQLVLPPSLEDAILSLTCANFFLPGLALYKLSQSEFGKRQRSLGLSLLYKGLHLLLINVPYLVIRLYLWTTFGRDISLFLMKNILSIFALVLTTIPDVRYWLILMEEDKKKAKRNNETLELNVIHGMAENRDEANRLKNADQFHDVALQDESPKTEFNSRL